MRHICRNPTKRGSHSLGNPRAPSERNAHPHTSEGGSITSIQRPQGSQAIVLISAAKPGRLVAARVGNSGGVAIGVGEGEMYVASDIPGKMVKSVTVE